MESTGNKLISEFMGYEVKHGKCYSPKYNDGTIAPMQFDTSWDWLMPVVKKCYETEVVVQPVVEGGCSGLITFPLIGLPYMESTYNAVVKFIKEYNNEQ